MKVNIRYTVDLEEVLEEMSNLYYKNQNWTSTIISLMKVLMKQI